MLSNRKTSVVSFLLSVMLGAGVLGVLSQSTEDRISDLEDRMLRLEATVAAMAEDGPTADSGTELQEVTGLYIERPERISGTSCTNFYPAGTAVILSDVDGNVLDTGELGEGELLDDGLCGQPFTFEDIPESPLYTFNVERRAIGSAYEITLEEMEENNWEIEVYSRYRK